MNGCVAVCATGPSAAAIRWAATEARRGGRPLHVLRPTSGDALVLASADAALLVVPAGLPELTAFRIAEQRGSLLTAVRVWHLDTASLLGSSRLARLRAWDRAYERSREALDADLSAWRVAYPDVDVRTVLADDDSVAFLGALAARAELLVIGGSARFARLAPSASSILATSAGCSVLVVPPGWPPHRGWLHAGRHILAGAR